MNRRHRRCSLRLRCWRRPLSPRTEAGGGAACRRRAADDDRELWRLDLRCQRLADLVATSKLCEMLTHQAGRAGADRPDRPGAAGQRSTLSPTAVSRPIFPAERGELLTGPRTPMPGTRLAALRARRLLAIRPTNAQGRLAARPTWALEFIDAVGRPVKLPVSFRGLAQAMDAWSRNKPRHGKKGRPKAAFSIDRSQIIPRREAAAGPRRPRLSAAG